MSLFIETIKFQQGKAQQLNYHQRRFDDTRKEYFGLDVSTISLQEKLYFPSLDQLLIYKCTVVYGRNIESISIRPYQLKTINSLQLIHANDILYNFKYHDRKILTECFNAKQIADDVLIIKDGFVTDSYYANVVFKNKDGLFTPTHALLKGTKRQQLLDKGVIIEKVIHTKDLNQYSKVYLINSMIDLGQICIDIHSITV